jgi:hypothetical protein
MYTDSPNGGGIGRVENCRPETVSHGIVEGRRQAAAARAESFCRCWGLLRIAAGATGRLPLTGEEWVSGLRDMDHPERAPEPDAVANFRFVTPDYWKALGIPPLRGRYLEASDENRP